jgi:membrane associated rhomboid family serine protease
MNRTRNQIIFGVGFSCLAFTTLSIHQHNEYKKAFPNSIFSQLFTKNSFQSIKRFPSSLTERLEDYYKRNKLLNSIILMNGLVFVAWQIPKLNMFMNRHFMHSQFSAPHTLLLSTFSHSSFLHLAFNMYALQSFLTKIKQKLGDDQALAAFLTTGTLSSLFSHLYYTKFNVGAFASLGASGALWGILGL